jgi:serine/threonine protein kinase
VALPLADGMRYLHDQKVLWRDLKPANIGFDSIDGSLKLFDFGLSKPMNDESLRGHGCDVAGTYAYMAPETVKAIRTTAESDVYSFGVLLWELVTLKRPFPKSLRTNKTKFKEKVVVGGWRPSLQGIQQESRALKRLIDVCWDARPRNRPSFDRIWFLLIRIIAELEQELGPLPDDDSNNNKIFNRGKQRQQQQQQQQQPPPATAFFKAVCNRPISKSTPLQGSDCTAETEACADWSIDRLIVYYFAKS